LTSINRDIEHKFEISKEQKQHFDKFLSQFVPMTEDELADCGYRVLINFSEDADEKPTSVKPSGVILDEKKTFSPQELSDQDLVEYISMPQRQEYKKIFASHEMNILIISQRAMFDMENYLDLGRKTRKNSREQMGLMIGDIYQNKRRFVGVVSHFILADSWSSRVSVDVSHSDWENMEKEIDRLQQKRTDTFKYRKVGWWHTHPDMQVYMSQTDRETQIKYFNKEWQFAFVINPRHPNGAAKAFCGGTLQNAAFIVSEF